MPKTKITYQEAKIKAASYCAYQERYQQEVRDKLYTFGLPPQEVEELLSYLITEGFVNEERFAKAFAGGRFRNKNWGRIKIEKELVRRKISPYCIRKAFEEIEDEEYQRTIHELIEKKYLRLDVKNPLFLKSKIASYVIGKGYEPDIVWDILNAKFNH